MHLHDRQYGLVSHDQFLLRMKNSSSITKRLILDHTLNVHRGCVNTICWSENGTSILSGSDDEHLVVTDPFSSEVLAKVHSGHRENIFSAKFLPGSSDKQVVSCSGDGMIFHTDLTRGYDPQSNEGCFKCHDTSTTYEVRVLPQTPSLFLSCSDDGTLRLFDLRTKSKCLNAFCQSDILIRSHQSITSIDVNPRNSNEIVCGLSDESVRLYDYRNLAVQNVPNLSIGSQCELSMKGLLSCFIPHQQKSNDSSRITSVVFNGYGNEILASYSPDTLYLLDPKNVSSHEQIKEQLQENMKNKRTNSVDSQSSTSTTNESKEKQRNVKRLRLGGDWSDTGPDSRPENDAGTTDSSSNGANRTRNLQNFFMQRMSEIFTQMVANTTTESEHNQENQTSNSAAAEPVESQESLSLDSASNSSLQNNQIDNNLRQMIMMEDSDDETDSDQDDSDDDDEYENDAFHNESSSSSDQTQPENHNFLRGMIPKKRHSLKNDRETTKSREKLFLENAPSLGLVNCFDGHRNVRTMIKEANFWSDSYILSGSDCGHIFIWNKSTGEIVRIIQGDEHVVNCVQPHPLNYPILASSGIDYNIKLFSPVSDGLINNSELIEETVKRNRAMIKETTNTIRIPSGLMFRVLTSMYRLQHSDNLSDYDDD